MSLEDYIRKQKKKAKKAIKADDLLKQIEEGTSRQKLETEKKVDEKVDFTYDDGEDWEPIVNDVLDVDFSNTRINNLATVKAEEEQAAAIREADANKSEEPKAVWGGKQAKEGVVEPEKEKVEDTKPKVYVPNCLRNGPARSSQPLPDLESAEEFPTLGAAVQEKPKKKNVPVESPDNSWIDATKGSGSHRKEEPSVSGTTSNPYRSDVSRKYVPPALRDSNFSRPSYSMSDRNAPSSSPGWNRGGPQRPDFRSPSQPVNISGWAKGASLVNRDSAPADNNTSQRPSNWERKPTTQQKEYTLPHQRDILSFTQQNRFAPLDNS